MSNMAPETWSLIEALFHDAMEQPEAQREDWVNRQCGDDRRLREQVTTLLRSAQRANDTLDLGVQVRSSQPALTRTRKPGDRIGRYRILEMVGQGGMGVVYRAERDDGQFKQQVALKLLKPEAAGHLHRFEAERQLLAGLDHPGIARLIDGGLTDDDQPFMAMEFVNGVPLLEFSHGHQLDLDARLTLFDQVCAAVDHAHRNLIVHRDLKSGNILVTPEGRVKLLDFGIAKLLPAEGWNSEDEATRNAPLTPDHAAPEQLLGQRVTTATDVYALGVVLYRLLSGRSPWRQLQTLPLTRAIQAVLNTEAPPLSQAAEAQGAAFARSLRGDLEAIVARALRKSTSGRYPTVEALQDDLDRYRAGKPVQARAGSRAYRFSRYLRQYRWPLAISLALISALSALNLRLSADKQRIAAAEADARAEAAANRQVTEYLIGLFREASPDRAGRDGLRPEDLVELGRRQAEQALALQPGLHSRLMQMFSGIERELGRPMQSVDSAERALASAPDAVARARALLALTHAQLQAGRAEDALASAQALNRNLPVEADARLRTESALALAQVELSAHRLQGAEGALQRARASLSELTPADLLLEARLIQADATHAALSGDWPGALALQQPLLQRLHAELGPEHSAAQQLQLSIGQAQLWSGQLEQAEGNFAAVLRRADQRYPSSSSWLAELRLYHASALSMLSRYAQAESEFAQVVQTYEELKVEDSRLASALLSRARNLSSHGDYLAAARSAQAALAALAGQDQQGGDVIFARIALAEALLGMAQYAAALRYLRDDLPDALLGQFGSGYRGLRQLLMAQAHLGLQSLPDAQTALDDARNWLHQSQPAGDRVFALLDYVQAQIDAAHGNLQQAIERLDSAWPTASRQRGASAAISLQMQADLARWLAQTGATQRAQPLLAKLRSLGLAHLSPHSKVHSAVEAAERALTAAQQQSGEFHAQASEPSQ